MGPIIVSWLLAVRTGCRFAYSSGAGGSHQNGTLASPNFPGLYPRNTRCTYILDLSPPYQSTGVAAAGVSVSETTCPVSFAAAGTQNPTSVYLHPRPSTSRTRHRHLPTLRRRRHHARVSGGAFLTPILPHLISSHLASLPTPAV